MTPAGKHAPASPRSFYMSLGRHAAAAVAVVGVVALVIAMATRDTEPTGTDDPIVSPSASGSQTIEVSPSASASPTATREARARNKIVVSVYNGTTRSGLASSTSDKIVQAGFRVNEVSNAETQRAKTVIFYRKGFEPEAQLLLDDFPDLLRIKPAGNNPEVDTEAQLTVILGADYQT